MSDHKPMRILHVLTAMNRGGAETMLMNLYRKMDREKIQFDFAVTTSQHCDYDDEIDSLGGRIIRYSRYKGANHFSYVKWWKDFFPRHPEYRIIHGHIGSTAAIYLAIAKKNGRFAIAHSHNTSMSALYRIYSYPTRYVADYFMACSKGAMVSRYGKKVAGNPLIGSILHNGIDVSQYEYNEAARRSVRTELGLRQDAFVIGTVGRFAEQKNPFFIVDILCALRQKVPDFRFLWAGRGKLQEDVEQYIARKGLQQNVLLLGVRDDIPRVLQAMDAFILPSKYEGLSVASVEAQAAGLPVWLSDKIPEETKITSGCQFLPIVSPELWAENLLKEKSFRRIETATDDVIKAGYDVHNTALWLADFYEKRWT